MLTSNVKKYELSADDTRALQTVRAIIEELDDEGFFDEDPFCDYDSTNVLDLINEIFNHDGEAIG